MKILERSNIYFRIPIQKCRVIDPSLMLFLVDKVKELMKRADDLP